MYTEYEPSSQNYKQYTYDEPYGKSYFWKNYDNGVYTERRFDARTKDVNYYASRDEGLTRWSYQMATLFIISFTCCFIVSVCACCLSCVMSRQKKKMAEKKALELKEIEGIGMEEDDEEDNETNTKGKDDYDIDGKSEAKGNKRKRKSRASAAKIDV